MKWVKRCVRKVSLVYKVIRKAMGETIGHLKFFLDFIFMFVYADTFFCFVCSIFYKMIKDFLVYFIVISKIVLVLPSSFFNWQVILALCSPWTIILEYGSASKKTYSSSIRFIIIRSCKPRKLTIECCSKDMACQQLI